MHKYDLFRYHHTAPISTVYALRAALAVLAKEGLDASISRHRQNAALLYANLQTLGLDLFVAEPVRSFFISSLSLSDMATALSHHDSRAGRRRLEGRCGQANEQVSPLFHVRVCPFHLQRSGDRGRTGPDCRTGMAHRHVRREQRAAACRTRVRRVESRAAFAGITLVLSLSSVIEVFSCHRYSLFFYISQADSSIACRLCLVPFSRFEFAAHS